MSLRLMPTSSTEEPVMISNDGNDRSRTSISTVRSSRRPVAQLLAHLLARRRSPDRAPRAGSSSGAVGRRRQQQVEQPLLGVAARPCRCTSSIRSSRTMSTADLDQVAHHRLDVAPDVADLGELRGLDLDERRLREPREAPRDLRLADAGRPDHQDVLRRHLLGQLGRQLLPAHAGCAGRSPPRAWRLCWPTTYLSSSATIWRGVSDSVDARQRRAGRWAWNVYSSSIVRLLFV